MNFFNIFGLSLIYLDVVFQGFLPRVTRYVFLEALALLRQCKRRSSWFMDINEICCFCVCDPFRISLIRVYTLGELALALVAALISKPHLVYGAAVLWRACFYWARVVYIGKLETSSSTLSSLAESSEWCKTHKFERKGWQEIERHAEVPQDRIVSRVQITLYWLSKEL